MSSSDLENLISMGFEKPRAELALRKSSGIQGAIDWLEKNQDTSTDALLSLEDASTAEDQDFGTTPLNPGEEAKSLLCKDCGRKLRSVQAAEFHAEKTQHTNFEESTEEVTPLTEKEKKEKLEELRQKLAAKRAGVFDQDKADKKRNEDIRRKTTKDSQDIKEELRKKELLKDAAAKKREKQEDALAKQKIKDQIAADKENRRLKAEREKAERAGQAPPPTPAATPVVAQVGSKPASSYKETRMRLQTPGGTITKIFPVETTLFEVAAAVKQEAGGFEASSFTQNFPKKTFDAIDFGATLKELSLIPSASLIVK